ncbi:MAG: hypothetical protein IIV74_01590, partial [Alphaproteobacteria bacterium]|nr:hypothetical protein [Alphaproteobacteria bacterium]
ASGFIIQTTSTGLNADIPFSGGKVTFTKAPKATDVISIYRKLELKRHIDYQPTMALTPTLMNQDMNFMLEILKDMKNELLEFADKYAQVTNQESTDILLSRIDMTMSEIDNVSEQIAAVRQEITNLGDVQSIHASISELNASVADLRTTLDLTNSNITTLQEFKTAVSDYVVQSQTPTSSNNYTWYRKYKSGWVEQGGLMSNGALTGQVTLSATMPIETIGNTIMASPVYISGQSVVVVTTFISGKTINVTLEKNNTASSQNTTASARWFVCGQCVE